MNKEKIMEGVKLILEGIGEDVNREGLIETPDRIARMYMEIFVNFVRLVKSRGFILYIITNSARGRRRRRPP